MLRILESFWLLPPPGKADQSPYGGKGNPEKCSPRKNTLSVGVALCKISIHADSTRAEIPERQKDIVHLFHLSFTLIWLISFQPAWEKMPSYIQSWNMNVVYTNKRGAMQCSNFAFQYRRVFFRGMLIHRRFLRCSIPTKTASFGGEGTYISMEFLLRF